MSRIGARDSNEMYATHWTQAIICDRCQKKVERLWRPAGDDGPGWRFAHNELRGWSNFWTHRTGSDDDRDMMDFCPSCSAVVGEAFENMGCHWGSNDEVLMSKEVAEQMLLERVRR